MLAVLACSSSAFQASSSRAASQNAHAARREVTQNAHASQNAHAARREVTQLSSRRAILLAAPLATAICGDHAAHAFNPLDVVFGWIPEVGCTSGDKTCGKAAAVSGKPPELSNAEKIRRRRMELEQEEQAKLMAEYQKNQSNRAASRATDVSGAR
jgi:hypothetical protein